MKIPLYYKSKQNDFDQCVEKNNQNIQKGAIKSKSAICEIENTIEIQVHSSYVCSYFIPYLLLSWIPIFFILFFVHEAVIHQIENQKIELLHLKTEVNQLSSEVLFLRTQMESLNILKMSKEILPLDESGKKFRMKSLHEENRRKRDTAEEVSNTFKGTAASQRKLSNSNAGRRGKQSNKRGKGFQAVHLKGAHPETVVEAGHIGPWFMDTKAVKDGRLSSSFQLREDGESLEVETAGLYFIYAQVYYLTSHTFNSFQIKVAPKDLENPVTLAYCSGSSVSASSTSEVSCFTAVVHTLQAGDRIFIQQREKNRRLIMRSGHSFLGMIRFVKRLLHEHH